MFEIINKIPNEIQLIAMIVIAITLGGLWAIGQKKWENKKKRR